VHVPPGLPVGGVVAQALKLGELHPEPVVGHHPGAHRMDTPAGVRVNRQENWISR
jgi:hypothetical protein